jgi:acetyl esterase/lipase
VPTSPSSRSVCEPTADPASPACRFDTLDAVYVRPVGHSAGGQLAVWAASRRRHDRGGPSAVTITRCVCLTGVLDLSGTSRPRLGGRSVDLLMGGTPAAVPDHYDQGDPTRLVPAGYPVACVHGMDDRIVPREQSTAYVAAAEAVGAPVSFDEAPATTPPWSTRPATRGTR